MNRLLPALLALSVVTLACPDPTEPDPGDIVDPVVDAGPTPGVADGTVTVKYLGLPVHLRVINETTFSDTPSYLDGGAVWTGAGGPVVDAQVTDSVTGPSGTAAGTASIARTAAGVVFTHTADVSRGAVLKGSAASMSQQVNLCVAGPNGKQARLDVDCQGTVTITGGGGSGLLVGTNSNDGLYCTSMVDSQVNLPLPKSGTATKTISNGTACFEVWVRWTTGANTAQSVATTVKLAGGKVTVTGTLLP